jgi:hypothetical protein
MRKVRSRPERSRGVAIITFLDCSRGLASAADTFAVTDAGAP